MLRVKPDDSLPAQLKALRDARILTQRELAEHLGVSTRTVQNWEAGMLPRPKHRRALKALLEEAA